MRVVFVNENALGHASYLLPFVGEMQRDASLGIEPTLLHATPVPGWRGRVGSYSIRGLRRYGLDWYATRWRMAASRYTLEQVTRACRDARPGAVVVNTQSVALSLGDFARKVPLVLCMDATFEQLLRSGWLATNGISRRLAPVTVGSLLRRERRMVRAAAHFCAWSEAVRQSLIQEYGVEPSRVTVLPPSVRLADTAANRSEHRIPQILFVGGDFRRKGGPLLRDCFRRHFAGSSELHILTQSEDVEPGPGEFVHRNLRPHSPEWTQRWREADVFVFPSRLETFGIVLLEALSFGVPVVSSTAGAAGEILAGGQAGILVETLGTEDLARAIRAVLDDPETTRHRVEAGRKRIQEAYDLRTNTARLSGILRDLSGSVGSARS